MLKLQNKEKNVAVVLGYFEGKKFIKEQLFSIFNQSHEQLEVFLVDDFAKDKFDKSDFGFSDDQLAKLTVFRREKNVGFALNFLYSLSVMQGNYEYFAFSDQDDIWHKDKIEKAVNKLSSVNEEIPAIYCAKTKYVSEDGGTSLGCSSTMKKAPSFSNALVQNIAGGNTMVLNEAACKLVVSTLSDFKIISHDWWCYLIVIGAGGLVIYDPEPCLDYRQHKNNLVGENRSFRGLILRISRLISGNLRNSCQHMINGLEKNEHLLTPENLHILKSFKKARNTAFFSRIRFFIKSGVHRQKWYENIALFFAVVFQKM